MRGKLYPTVIKKATGSMARGGMYRTSFFADKGILIILYEIISFIHIYNILTIKRIRLGLYENVTKTYLAFCSELEFQVSVATSTCSMVTLSGLVQ